MCNMEKILAYLSATPGHLWSTFLQSPTLEAALWERKACCNGQTYPPEEAQRQQAARLLSLPPWKSGTTQVLAGRTVSHKAHRPSWQWVWPEHGQWTPSHPIQKKAELIRPVNGKWWKCQTLKDTLLRSTLLKMLTKMVICSPTKTISTNHKILIFYTTRAAFHISCVIVHLGWKNDREKTFWGESGKIT